MMDIQYPEALNEKGHAIKAESLTRDTCCGHRFRCPHCHEEMIPVLGDVRAKHFRHLGAQCQRDYYLHGLAEASFMEEYQKCIDKGLPFYLEMLVPTCFKSCVLTGRCEERHVRKLDLTIDFKIITQESRVKTGDKTYRRPDILLQSEDGKQSLWIEFFVTHEVGEEKQKTGRIVEIKISSEKDIETVIRAHKIVQSDDKEHWVRLYNLVPPCDKAKFHSYIPIPKIRKPSVTRTDSQNTYQEETENVHVNWIDLGLPSGVLWANVDGRPEQIEGPCEIPGRTDIEELKKWCKQEVYNDELKVIGPNGNTIVLKAAKYRLSSHRYPDSIDMVSIFALVGDDYLHIFDDDYSAKHKFRCVRRPRTNIDLY